MKVGFGNTLAIAFGCFVAAAIVGFILNCIVFPIGYLMMHDCGKWICEHKYPMTWGSFAIVSSIVFIILFLIALYAESSSKTYTYTPSRRRVRKYTNDRETDYYDSDMEGAPDYYGFD